MYTLHLTVMPFMDLMYVSGSIMQHLDDDSWAKVASFDTNILLSDAWLAEDPSSTLIEAVRQWSEMTSRA